MLEESRFHALANATLMHINDQLEQAYDTGQLDELDLDEGGGLLTIITPDDVTFVINKHAPSGQIWLASPLSGGLHFDFDEQAQEWRLSDGRTLKAILAGDLEQSCGLRVVL